MINDSFLVTSGRLRFAGRSGRRCFARRYFFAPHCFARSIFCAKVDGECTLFWDSEVEIWGEVVKVHEGNLY